MQRDIRLVIPIVIFIVLSLVFLCIFKEEEKFLKNIKKNNYVCIYLPRTYVFVGFVAVVVFSLFLINAIKNVEPIFVCIIFVVFILLGIVVTIASLNWKIVFCNEEDFFTYRNCFGRKYKIYYSNCIQLNENKNLIILKTTNKTFYMDPYAIGVFFLVKKINLEMNKKTDDGSAS